MESVNKQLLDSLKLAQSALCAAQWRLNATSQEFTDVVHAVHVGDIAIAAAEQAQEVGRAIEWQCRRKDWPKWKRWKNISKEEFLHMQANAERWHDYEIRQLLALNQPPAVAVPELRQVRRAQDGMPSANYAEGFDHGWNDCIYEVRAMLAAAPQVAVAVPDVTEVARAIWNIRREEEDRCDMELEDIPRDHSVWREAEAVMLAAAQKGG